MDKMSGSVEADDAYIDSKDKSMHADKREERINGRDGSGKIILMGTLARAAEMNVSNIRTKVIADTTNDTLHGRVQS